MATPEEVRQQQKDDKFDRNLKIVAGVVSVLGVAATTVMTIMQAEKEIRSKRKKRRPVHRIKGPGIKALKSPTKKKAGRLKPVINVKDLLKLEKQAEKALDAAQELKEEIENGRMSDAQTEK